MGGLLVVTDEHPLLPHPARGAIVWVVPNQTVIPGPDGVDIATNGRTTLWIHPAMPPRFTFDRRDLDPLDPELLHKLAAEASSTAGITIDQALIEAHQAA